MKMTISPEVVAQKLSDGYDDEFDSSGSDCMFIDMQNGWGIKCYWDKEARAVSYLCQKYAASLGFAPEVGKQFTVVDPCDGNEYFCHLTEVVETIVEYGIDNDHCMDDDEYEDPPFYEERLDWIYEFEEVTEFDYADNHAGNFGFKNGKLVCIDWDKCCRMYQILKRRRKNAHNK